jgi:hypothetical protein
MISDSYLEKLNFICFEDPDIAKDWLLKPRPEFSGESAADLIKTNRERKLERFIDDQYFNAKRRQSESDADDYREERSGV